MSEDVRTVHIAVVDNEKDECIMHWNVIVPSRSEDEDDDIMSCIGFLEGKGYDMDTIQWGVVKSFREFHN